MPDGFTLAARFLPGRRVFVTLVCLLWLGPLLAIAPAGAAPQRVVSLNLCTDQLAMLIAAPGQLHAVSHLARDPRSSAMVEQAMRYAVTRGGAEAVFRLRPDLVLAGTYTTAVAVQMLQRLGVPVERFAPANTFADVIRNLRRMGELLGRQETAEALVARQQDALAQLQQMRSVGQPLRAVFLDANSYTAGAGTLMHAMLEAAGFENIAASRGLYGTARLPLEVLVLARPDLLLTTGRYDPPSVGEAVLDHPALRHLHRGRSRTVIAGQTFTCGTPFTLAVARQLAAVRIEMQAAAAARRSRAP
tara:strand:- start:154 stop:1065 length:912 start_codon:yes stop_codon:yes gene_type:complete